MQDFTRIEDTIGGRTTSIGRHEMHKLLPDAKPNFGFACVTLIAVMIVTAIAMQSTELWAQHSPDAQGHTQIDQTITLVTIADARSGVAKRIDLGDPGDSPGDMFVFDQPLLNSSYQPIGTNSGFCIRTVAGQFSECQWTLTLANGTITVAGREADNGTSIIPVIGGSGDYLFMRGVVATTPNGDKTFTQVLTLRPR